MKIAEKRSMENKKSPSVFSGSGGGLLLEKRLLNILQYDFVGLLEKIFLDFKAVCLSATLSGCKQGTSTSCTGVNDHIPRVCEQLYQIP